MRFSKADHSLSAGIYAVDFAARPEILLRRPRLNLQSMQTGECRVGARQQIGVSSDFR